MVDNWQREILTELKQTQVMMAETLRQMNDSHKVMCSEVAEVKVGVVNLRDMLMRIVFVLVGVVALIAAGEKVATLL